MSDTPRNPLSPAAVRSLLNAAGGCASRATYGARGYCCAPWQHSIPTTHGCGARSPMSPRMNRNAAPHCVASSPLCDLRQRLEQRLPNHLRRWHNRLPPPRHQRLSRLCLLHNPVQRHVIWQLRQPPHCRLRLPPYHHHRERRALHRQPQHPFPQRRLVHPLHLLSRRYRLNQRQPRHFLSADTTGSALQQSVRRC